jgi:hypothetical protein
MRAPYLHPEFGYFCPTPGLRRTVKMALAFTVIGALAGAGGMAALIADHDSNLDGVSMTAHADLHGAEQQPGASAPAMVKAEATPAQAQADTAKPAAKTERIKLDIGKSEVAKSEASKPVATKPDATKSETGTVSAKSEAGKIDTAAVEAAKAAKVDASKTSAAKIDGAAATSCEGNACCEGNTWASLNGTCGSGQVRKMRIVRVPTANRASASCERACRGGCEHGGRPRCRRGEFLVACVFFQAGARRKCHRGTDPGARAAGGGRHQGAAEGGGPKPPARSGRGRRSAAASRDGEPGRFRPIRRLLRHVPLSRRTIR